MVAICIFLLTDFSFHFILFTGLSTATIRNVSLQVDPPSVRRGQHATFICSYDLDGAPLYSVKFYRGNHEFYRYSPSELPTSKVFQFVGFNVDVSLIQLFFHFIYKYIHINWLNSTVENRENPDADFNGFTNIVHQFRDILPMNLDVFIGNQISISGEQNWLILDFFLILSFYCCYCFLQIHVVPNFVLKIYVMDSFVCSTVSRFLPPPSSCSVGLTLASISHFICLSVFFLYSILCIFGFLLVLRVHLHLLQDCSCFFSCHLAVRLFHLFFMCFGCLSPNIFYYNFRATFEMLGLTLKLSFAF